jgi:hypothetical protein
MAIGKGWTRTHGFFIIMGGFHAFTRDDSEKRSHGPGTPWYPLHQDIVLDMARKGEIQLPLKEEIQEKSKTDWLAKTIVLLQTGWFVLQCIARGVARLPLSELEVVTLAYAAMNVCIYMAWWDKPRNVDYPIRVFMSEKVIEQKRKDAPRDEPPINGQNSGLNYIARLIIPGVDKYVNLYQCSSVPTFYSGKPDRHHDFWRSSFIASAVGVVFGAIHFIAWPYSFPSHTEQLLWRLSSIAMVGVPVCVFVGSGIYDLVDRIDSYLEESVVVDICHPFLILAMYFFLVVSVVLGPLTYVAARAITFVLAFKTLISLPAAVFQTIPWTKWIPHI